MMKCYTSTFKIRYPMFDIIESKKADHRQYHPFLMGE